VLQEFAKQERELAGKVIEAVAAEVPRLIAGDEGGFMSRVAFLLAPPKPKKEKLPEQPATSKKDGEQLP
jgi:PTH1 family peptidyl-tRNA hydrolase